MNVIKYETVPFANSNLSAALSVGPGHEIIAIETANTYSGNTLAGEFSPDGGVSWEPVYNESGTQTCKISDASMNAGRFYSLTHDNWAVSDSVKFRSSGVETTNIKVFLRKM